MERLRVYAQGTGRLRRLQETVLANDLPCPVASLLTSLGRISLGPDWLSAHCPLCSQLLTHQVSWHPTAV